MPNIPAKWRKWCYGVSIALVPILVIAGWASDELAVALIGLANAVFIGGLAFTNVTVPAPAEGADDGVS